MTTRKLTAFCIALGFGLTSSALWAQEELSGGFSDTRIRNIRVAPKGKASDRSCMKFQADFSGPLAETPSAVLDVEMFHLIEGAISFVLEVTRISPRRVEMNMVTDETACKALLEKGQKVNVTVQNATGTDGLTVLPDQTSFIVP